MASVLINGMALPIYAGTSISIASSSTTEFQLSWTGMPTSSTATYPLIYINVQGWDETYSFSSSSLTNSPSSNVRILFAGSDQIWGCAYLRTNSADGSVNVTIAAGLIGKKLKVSYFTDSTTEYYCDVTFYQNTPQACYPPSNVSVSATESVGGSVPLAFTEGAGNTLNTFSDYQVQYSDDSGSTWADLTTGTSSPISVAVPSTVGVSRTYRIRTRGSSGSSYYSSWAYSSNSVLRTFSVSQPNAGLVTYSGSHCELYVALSSSITGGTGTITYEFYRSGDSTPLLSTTDSTMHYTVAESSLSSTNSFYIKATCTINGITKATSSDPVVFTYDPTFTDASGLGVSPQTGSQATLTWTPGSLSGGGTVSHQLSVSVDSGVTYTVLSSAATTPYVVTQSDFETWGVNDGDEVRFTLVASGNGNTGVTQLVTFTYSESASGSIFVSYYDGSSFVDCYADRWDGTQWVRQELEMLEQGE